VELRPAKFNIGEKRELDIAFKYAEEPKCFAVNGDNWHSVDLKDEKKQLDGSNFMAKIRLRGPHIDTTWTVEFRNQGIYHQLEPLKCVEG